MKYRIVYSNPKRYFLGDKEVTEAAFLKRMKKSRAFGRKRKGEVVPGGLANTQSSSLWPKKSRTMGVLPRQRMAAMAADAKNGVPTEYDNNGDVIFRDRGHQKEWLNRNRAVDYGAN